MAGHFQIGLARGVAPGAALRHLLHLLHHVFPAKHPNEPRVDVTSKDGELLQHVTFRSHVEIGNTFFQEMFSNLGLQLEHCRACVFEVLSRPRGEREVVFVLCDHVLQLAV